MNHREYSCLAVTVLFALTLGLWQHVSDAYGACVTSSLPLGRSQSSLFPSFKRKKEKEGEEGEEEEGE